MNIKGLAQGTYELYFKDNCCPTTACHVEAFFDTFGSLAAVVWSGVIVTQVWGWCLMGRRRRARCWWLAFLFRVGVLVGVLSLWSCGERGRAIGTEKRRV
jgi:hypothetical protein